MEVNRLDFKGTTSSGTGTTKTENANSPYLLDADVAEIEAIIPRQAATAAYTAGESVRTVTFLESGDVKVDPVRIFQNPIMGGLGTSAFGLISVLQKYPLNILAKTGQRMRLWAQEMVANTAAMRQGASLAVRQMPSGKPQVYWDVSGSDSPAVTAAGTAAARKQLTNMTISDMKRVVKACAFFVPTVVTASTDYVAWVELICSGFKSAAPFTFGTQPIASHLGAAVSAGQPDQLIEDVDREFKSAGVWTLQQFVNIEVAQPGDGSLIAMIGTTKK